MFGIEGQYDIVRATFADGTNVPRIPPQRVGGGVFWRDAHWFARVSLLHAFRAERHRRDRRDADRRLQSAQGRAEPTPGRCSRTISAARVVTVGVVGNNLLNDDIRNHVSFKKDEVLMPGRGVRLFATLKN